MGMQAGNSYLPSTLRPKGNKILFRLLILALLTTLLVIIVTSTTVFQRLRALVGTTEIGLVPHSDPFLNYVRENYLVPPSNKPYNMSTKKYDTSMGQAQAVFEILNGQKNGFFVECGALDGETRSNTYWFERYHGWSGVLIEPDPKNFQLLLAKHRKAYAVPACLSSSNHPAMFKPHFHTGKIISKKKKGSISVECFTLWTVMLALNNTRIMTIDYFSLDVEGHELEVLRGIPFESLDIRTMSVEWTHVPEGKDFVRRFVESKGYLMVKEVTAIRSEANDFIFVKNQTAFKN